MHTIPQVMELKERANAIFKLGRYEHALGLYQEAIRLACAEVESTRYYGQGYEDVQHRRPSIRNAKTHIGWEPRITTRESVERTLDWFLRQHAKDHGLTAPAGAASATRGPVAATRKP